MYELVWIHEQWGTDDFICVFYDRVTDSTKFEIVSSTYGSKVYHDLNEVSSFYSKLLLCGSQIAADEMSGYYGLVIYSCGLVRTYIAVRELLGCKDAYLVVEVDKVLSSITLFSREYIKADYASFPVNGKIYIIIRCDVTVLMLMTQSERFKMSILGRLKFKGYYCGVCHIVSSLEGLKCMV